MGITRRFLGTAGGIAAAAAASALVTRRSYIAQMDEILQEHQRTLKAQRRLAAQDKAIAIRQMSEQVAAAGSLTDTQGFDDLKAQYPWLDKIRKTIGLFETESMSGSGVLLDKDGTIVLCAHEWGEKPAKITFYMTGGLDNFTYIPASLSDFQLDKGHDLMFATIDPKLIKKHGLIPAQFGSMGYSDEEKGRKIIHVGWPGPSLRLHATTGKIIGFKDAVKTNAGPTACQIETDAVIFHGMSGGGGFAEDGKLLVMSSSLRSPGMKTRTYAPPADLIRTAYVTLYPDRARRAGITMPSQGLNAPEPPEACRVKRRGFLTGIFTK